MSTSDSSPRRGADLLVPGVALGRVLAGKYRLERVLGRGGMGVVVAARHDELRRRVAIKFLLPHASDLARSGERLAREARAVGALQGRHIARVYDVGTLESGAPYIVMEYLDGRTLAALLKERGRLEPSLAVDYALHACEALAEAHGLHIVHRDLKPSNLYLADGPGRLRTLKVLDFGISKTLEGDAMETSTERHALLGSPPYMSPEQLVSPRGVDARTDIWSLGVVLHECLSGQLPFVADSFPSLCNAILTQPVPSLSARAGVSQELEAVVLRCLSRDPGQRYANVLELSRALAAFGSAHGITSLPIIEALCARAEPPTVAAQTPSAKPGAATLTEAGTVRTLTRGARGKAGLTAIVVLGMVGIAMLLSRAARETPAAAVLAVRASSTGRAAASAPVAPQAPGQSAEPAASRETLSAAAAASARGRLAIRKSSNAASPAPPVASSIAPEAQPPEPPTVPLPTASSEPDDEAVYENRK